MKSSPLFGLGMRAAFGCREILKMMLQPVPELENLPHPAGAHHPQPLSCTFYAHFSEGKFRRKLKGR